MTTQSDPTQPPFPQQAQQPPFAQPPTQQQPPTLQQQPQPQQPPTQQPPTQYPLAQQASSPGTPPAAHVANPEPAAWPAPAAQWGQPVAQDSPQSWPGPPAKASEFAQPAATRARASRLGRYLSLLTVLIMAAGLVFPNFRLFFPNASAYISYQDTWQLPIWRRVETTGPPVGQVLPLVLAVVGLLVLTIIALVILGLFIRGHVVNLVAMGMVATFIAPGLANAYYNVNRDDIDGEMALHAGGYLLSGAFVLSLVTIVVLVVTRPRT